jgi:hypothetical protein
LARTKVRVQAGGKHPVIYSKINRILGLEVDKDLIKDDNIIAYFQNRLKRRVMLNYAFNNSLISEMQRRINYDYLDNQLRELSHILMLQ